MQFQGNHNRASVATARLLTRQCSPTHVHHDKVWITLIHTLATQPTTQNPAFISIVSPPDKLICVYDSKIVGPCLMVDLLYSTINAQSDCHLRLVCILYMVSQLSIDLKIP